MHLFLQMSKLQETTSYFDENVGRLGVKSDTVQIFGALSPLERLLKTGLGSVCIVEIQKKTIDKYCLLFHAAQGNLFFVVLQ